MILFSKICEKMSCEKCKIFCLHLQVFPIDSDDMYHEPLLLDSLVQIKLWKSLKLIFLENSFNKDKSVGL